MWVLQIWRRGLKVNAGKSKGMLVGGEEGLECEVCINGYVQRMSWNLNTQDVFWANQVEMRQNVVEMWQVGEDCRCYQASD